MECQQFLSQFAPAKTLCWLARPGWPVSTGFPSCCQEAVPQAERPAMFAGEVYNIVDDDPASRTEVMAYARHLLTGADYTAEKTGPAAEPESQPQQVTCLSLLRALVIIQACLGSRHCKTDP